VTTIGSLCSGYAGLDLAAEQVTGGTTVWHCEYEAAPSALLAHRFPGVPNHHDVKTLTWADHPVDVLTGGYPCQPFSGAGKRLGTDDPRHIFPWIAMGIERMRPPLVLLENVRGHLTLGFDVVLAELHRLGYDVRWTLLRAADVGAPHGRARLWIAARAREVGGWPRPAGEPTAYYEPEDATRRPGLSEVRRYAGWYSPASGLFGDVAAQVPGTAGVMVNGMRWDGVADVSQLTGLLPTPVASDAHTPPSPKRMAEREVLRGSKLPLSERVLLPTPDAAAALGGHGARGGTRSDELLLPGVAKAYAEGALLPTPKTGPNRASRGALTGTGPGCDRVPGGQWSAPQLEQALELARGELPREYESWDEVRGASAALLPTPAATDARGARNSTSGRKADSQHHSGDTLGDLVFDGRLLPTPAVNDMGAGKTVEAWDEWTAAQRAKHGTRNGHGPSLSIEAARHGAAWGPYAAAVARWEALTRPAPAPTEQGRSGPRLSPIFVEWMQGLDAGWVTAVPDLTRNQMLTMLGNGVVPQCGAVAYALLGVSPDLWKAAAA